jgi:hypothetical protein
MDVRPRTSEKVLASNAPQQIAFLAAIHFRELPRRADPHFTFDKEDGENPMSIALALTPVSYVGQHLEYQRQFSSMTLAQGLEEYYRVNAGRVLHPDDLSEESRELFRSHDMCHVIFGLDTTLDDETMADVRTVLSCDVGFRRYTRYLMTNPEAKALFRELGYARAVWLTLLAVPRIFRAIAENWRMTKKWPWQPPANYLDCSLSDLRRKYGIRII